MLIIQNYFLFTVEFEFEVPAIPDLSPPFPGKEKAGGLSVPDPRRRSPVLRSRGKIRVTLKVVAGNPYDLEPARMTERQAVASSSTKSRCPPSQA